MDTRVYVLDRVSPVGVFVKCNQLLGATEGTGFWNEPVKIWQDETWQPGNSWILGNEVESELLALLSIYYRPDAPLRANDGDCLWFCGSNCVSEHRTRACWLEVSFDTLSGDDCGLHDYLVNQLGRWLDERDVRWNSNKGVA